MNIIIPLAGEGKRFSDEGHDIPKPFIMVNGKPMIQSVIENLSIDGNYIFIIQKKHSIEFNLRLFLKSIKPNCIIIEIDEVTDGVIDGVTDGVIDGVTEGVTEGVTHKFSSKLTLYVLSQQPSQSNLT